MNQSSGLAIIVKSTAFQEYDAIIELFTQKSGKVSVVAKGIRKDTSKNKGHCRVGSLVEYELFIPKNGGLGRLKKITTQKSCLSEDIREQSRIMILCEVSSRFLSEEHPEESIFTLWQELLSSFPLTQMRMMSFLIRFFEYEGLLPAFQKENLSQTMYWEEKQGIVQQVTPQHIYKKISLPIRKVFHFTANNPLSLGEKIALSPAQTKELWEIFWWAYSLHTDFLPRAKAVYEELS